MKLTKANNELTAIWKQKEKKLIPQKRPANKFLIQNYALFSVHNTTSMQKVGNAKGS